MLRISEVCGQRQEAEEPRFSCLFYVRCMQKNSGLQQALEKGILHTYGMCRGAGYTIEAMSEQLKVQSPLSVSEHQNLSQSEGLDSLPYTVCVTVIPRYQLHCAVV